MRGATEDGPVLLAAWSLGWQPETYAALSPGWEWKILAERDMRYWSGLTFPFS